MLEGKEEEEDGGGGVTLLDEEGRLRDVMIKCMRGRRERGNKVGSTASHWISLMLPAENRGGGEGCYQYMYKYPEHSNTCTDIELRPMYKQLPPYYSI